MRCLFQTTGIIYRSSSCWTRHGGAKQLNFVSVPRVFPGLSGSTVLVRENLPLEDARCVFCSTQCTVNSTVNVDSEHSTFSDGNQFGVSGIMILLRISLHTIPTVAIMESNVVIFGPRYSKPRIKYVIGAIFQPLRWVYWEILGRSCSKFNSA